MSFGLLLVAARNGLLWAFGWRKAVILIVALATLGFWGPALFHEIQWLAKCVGQSVSEGMTGSYVHGKEPRTAEERQKEVIQCAIDKEQPK